MFAGQRLRGLTAKEGAEDLQAVTRLIESGPVTPVIDRTYALADAPMRSATSPRVTPRARSS